MRTTGLKAEFQEPWVVLTLSVSQSQHAVFVSDWSVSQGKITDYSGTEQGSISSIDDEPELLEELARQLEISRSEKAKLITPSEQTLAVLRSRFYSTQLASQLIFRGYSHIPLGELIYRNFDVDCIDHPVTIQSLLETVVDDPEKRVEPPGHMLIDILSKIAPLLPKSEYQGEKL